MSFRTRLTTFFVLIVVVPMLAIGFLVFRLISDSEQGKADARANGLATAAASLYEQESALARRDAQTIARDPSLASGPSVAVTLTRLSAASGLARVTLKAGSQRIADVGDSTAVAPGSVTLAGPTPLTVAASELTAKAYADDLNAPGVGVLVREGGRTLVSTLPSANSIALPRTGTITAGGRQYRAVTQSFPGWGRTPITVAVLSDLSSTASSLSTSRLVAALFIAGFVVLALSFSVLSSRALQSQLGRFLQGARRLASGDFSSSIPTQGHDEFAALGEEFNHMSRELARRLDELSEERARLRDSIHRIGQTFAANLDRPALLELALKTAVDAVQAGSGRLSVRARSEEPLAEANREGSLRGIERPIHAAEQAALDAGELREASDDGVHVASVPLGALERGARAHGLITVARTGRPFNEDDRELLISLGAQATLALENVELHFQVRRQAITDELTGLANHGHFQERLTGEIEQVRRYHHPVGLIMLDLDDFKSINDTYGHQQGDVVLRHVARVLQENSRDADSPARYGGEELALILPHTDLEGAYAIAERVRSAIEGLRIPRLNHQGMLRITASVGVTASSDGDKHALIADADAALYEAKHQGKNRTVRLVAATANVSGAG